MADYVKRVPQSGGAPVQLSKVTLTKASPSISLAKESGARGLMRVNLNWSQGAGGLGKRASGIDLDLGCLWETVDGNKGVVQALGRAFGDLHRPPYVQLDGDDRSGAVAGGENLHVNLDHLDQIRRILIFAYIYEGVPNWAAADGVVTMYPQGGEIAVRLDEARRGRIFCAVAMLSNQGGQLHINREVKYIAGGHAELDRAYKWKLRWQRGRK